MKLTLTIDTMYVIKWWVDASHHTHMECREHTDAMMSLWKRGISQLFWQT